MGIGTCGTLGDAAEWNSGSCDVMAVALHRMYGFPLMAEFEWGKEDGKEVLGYLVHAWVRLPDGRALDAAGPRPMFEPTEGRDADDDWVEGYRIVEIDDSDPHLVEVREETDWVSSIESMHAAQWIWRHLGPTLLELGHEPIRYRSVIGLPRLAQGGDGTEGEAAPKMGG